MPQISPTVRYACAAYMRNGMTFSLQRLADSSSYMARSARAWSRVSRSRPRRSKWRFSPCGSMRRIEISIVGRPRWQS